MFGCQMCARSQTTFNTQLSAFEAKGHPSVTNRFGVSGSRRPRMLRFWERRSAQTAGLCFVEAAASNDAPAPTQTPNNKKHPPVNANNTSRRGPLSLARFNFFHAIAAAGLLLGGMGTATCRAVILYVSDATNKIEKYTSGGIGSVFSSSGLNQPEGLAFDSLGNLYAANFNFGTNTIEKFTPGGVASVFADANDGLSRPTGLAFDSAGNLYAANGLNATIVKITPGGVGSVFANTGLSGPQGLAFDSAGNLFVANQSNKIVKFTPAGVGSVFATVTTFANSLAGLAFDNAGFFYVTDVNANKILKFNITTGVSSVFASTGLNQPIGLAFDNVGNLFVANQGNATIQKFTPGGVGSVFASTGVVSPQFLAFTDDAGVPLKLANQVPETSTLATLAFGAASLLTFRRRRCKAQA